MSGPRCYPKPSHLNLTVCSKTTMEVIFQGVFNTSDINKEMLIHDFIKMNCPGCYEVTISAVKNGNGLSFLHVLDSNMQFCLECFEGEEDFAMNVVIACVKSIEVLESIHTFFFPKLCGQSSENEWPDDGRFFPSVLLNDHTEQLHLMNKLSSEEGADYEAFIVAKETWDAINSEKRGVFNLICDITDMHDRDSSIRLQRLCIISKHEVTEDFNFDAKMARIHELAREGGIPEAFVPARELLNGLLVLIKNNVEGGANTLLTLMNNIRRREGAEEGEEVDVEEWDADERTSKEVLGILFTLMRYYGGKMDVEEWYDNERTFQLIKQKKEKWKKEEGDPTQLHLMAKQFELNMMFEKLSGKRQGKVAKIIQAGHMGNLDEIFSPAPNPMKRKRN